MTPAAFRKLALSLPEAEERQHMSHPDFRVAGKIFATLGYPDNARGMVKLTPEQQHYLLKDFPEVFAPAAGAWGYRGSTVIHLKPATPAIVAKALDAAWRNTAPKRLITK